MRIVVSLSTIPSRVPYLSRIVNCIQQQTLPVDCIYINLPEWSQRENCAYPEPQLENDHNVKIIRCSDYGPLTKLYPVLQHELDPTTLIVTVDDDIAYLPERIALLAKWAQKYTKSAIGGTGFILGSWWNFFGTVRWPTEITSVDVLEGYSGCAYRRSFFQEDLIDYSGAPKEAFYHDDIWISGYLALKQIPRRVHPGDPFLPRIGNSGYGQEEQLSNGLSQNMLSFIWRILPLLFYFRYCFQEKQVVPSNHSLGFWILLVVVLLLVYLVTNHI